MQKWTREEKDQILNERDEKRLSLLHQQIRQSIWRGQYHIQTVTGLMASVLSVVSIWCGSWHEALVPCHFGRSSALEK